MERTHSWWCISIINTFRRNFEFYADNISYFSAEINNGYDGELEIANIPTSFLKDV